MITRGVTIREGSLAIHGRWYMDGREEKQPTIIICHEFGTNMRFTSRYAQMLCKQGYAVFIFDFCGSESGTSRGRKSTEMSVTTEVIDLLVVLDYVQDRPFVNKNAVFLMGCSQGGLVASLAAEKRKNEVKKLVLYYP
ncbi:alpha/beta hydrolase family protein, partial [Mogibacterium sp.]